jgi:hypothetical protein
MSVETGDKVTRIYGDFRGVDFRGEECGINRSPDSLNVWKNYKKLSSIETRPGLEHLYTFLEAEEKDRQAYIETMIRHNGALYFTTSNGWVHALYDSGTMDYRLVYVGNNAMLFTFEGQLYAKGAECYTNVTTGKNVDPYIPTTSISRKPSGGGTIQQDVNMLSPYRINTFRAETGTETVFHLDAKGLDTDEIPIVTIRGVEIPAEDFNYNKSTGRIESSNYSCDCVNGIINFNHDPITLVPNMLNVTDGQDNVSIKFKKTVAGYEDKIKRCTIAQEFDNRVFLSGHPDYPSTVWHSSLNDPSYFSDLDEYEDGADGAPIRSMVVGNNGLWVFRDDSLSNNSVFYHTPALDEYGGKIYPYSHSSISLGCVGRAINFNDDILFFSQRGMEGASTDITTEQFVTHRSSLVDRLMTAHDKYKDMVLAEWEGYLLVFIGGDVYLADSRAVMQIENHIEYEWYHWRFGDNPVTCATVDNGVLYVATKGDNGGGYIHKLTRNPEDGDEWVHAARETEEGYERTEVVPIESYWVTPKDNFTSANKLKTTNKRGCVAEASGDIAVYAKTDTTDFELIGRYEDIKDKFVSRIKRKKWKDIQLKFYSNTRFSLEIATLEAYVGGYVKR